jgi:hypothetical protein
MVIYYYLKKCNLLNMENLKLIKKEKIEIKRKIIIHN